MSMGRQSRASQGEFWIRTDAVPQAPAHPFYERLNWVLNDAGFDRFCEQRCEKFYAKRMGRPSIPPGVYFRMLMIGYFEKLDSERQIAWRSDDSRALRAFLGYRPDQSTPDHSSLSIVRQRIDVETHQAVFDWVLARLAERKLVKGATLGVDASTLEADAAMRSIVRKETGETYREFLEGLAKASGIATPTAADLARLDRARKDKKVGNDEWHNPYDPDAKITKLKDGRTHLAYKPEHAVDLETGAIVAAVIHPADQGDTTTIHGTLEQAAQSLQAVRAERAAAGDGQCGVRESRGSASAENESCRNESGAAASRPNTSATEELQIRAVVSDKGYHSAHTLATLEEIELRGYIAEPARGRQRWIEKDPDDQAWRRREQAAVYRNRRRLRRARSKALHRRRGEFVERSFEHVLDDGGMRRTWLKGREKVQKRYLIQVAAFNLGLILRALTGYGTPRGLADALRARIEGLMTWFRSARAWWTDPLPWPPHRTPTKVRAAAA
jgi:transposase